ncbi:MAG: carbamoyl-phosphate synthase large subunit [Ignavibacteria bacterium]|nr:carbamoyl-phosphate synthase large subunit [Ignavibacteria bacterium]
MPKRTDLKSILIIGSGPIVIGQACEFDYSGTQACKVLREEGYRVILINSNPATIMTDPELADATYIEPITPEFIELIIEKEKPNAILPTMGGQTALNVAVALAEKGILKKYNVELIGADLQAIKKAEDRELFQKTMREAGLEMPRGGFVHSSDEALKIVDAIGFPIIIRPSFTLGGTGGGIAYNIEEFVPIVEHGLNNSPIHEVLVEQSIIGWKEFELEVMRDKKDNVVIICSIENLDPMGVHTGDSITVAPAQTLTDKEYQSLRDAAIKVMRAIGVDSGGSNVQFAINPDNGKMYIIEMNPRVSRSSALASKATGYPIAKIAAKLAIGYTLDEIPNDITKLTPASFEPTIDYTVVKIPRWDFEKFKGVDDTLGIQMKSVGEAMSFGRTFKEALQKALRSMEQGRFGLGADGKDVVEIFNLNSEEKKVWISKVRVQLLQPKPENIFYLRFAFQLGMTIDEIFEITKIDRWFLFNIQQIVQFEEKLKSFEKKKLSEIPRDVFYEAKQLGFSDKQLSFLWKKDELSVRKSRIKNGIIPVYKTVDTCAAEFEASTPYHYSTYEQENESIRTDKKKIIILGGGPNRIGQGIEFDYCCVHGVYALREEGYETIMINCNPETISTDYDTTDKLYFEPLTFEDVLNICDHEKPDGIIVSFGGQTPLKLAKALEEQGIKILGTSTEGIDLAEDRQRFGDLLKKEKIKHPPFGSAFKIEDAVLVAEKIGFPVLVRPSYVLGGRAMQICYNSETVREYMKQAVNISPEKPVLIDKFLENASEFDVDAVCDGKDVLIGGVMEHIEEAGIHSGDSSCTLPPYIIGNDKIDEVIEITKKLAKALNVIGLLNIQFAYKDNIFYVLEVNPRASRTVPFVSKTTGIPLAKIAAKVMVGISLKELGVLDFDFRKIKHIAVKEAVFPFSKFPKVKMFLGPEMRSTGEVMGISRSFGESIAKGNLSAGNPLPKSGIVFISVNDGDKNQKILEIAKNFLSLGFSLIGTLGTSKFLQQNNIPCEFIFRVQEGRPNIVDRIKNGEVKLVINTPFGEDSRYDEYAIGWAAVQQKIAFITTISAAASAVKGIEYLLKKKHSVLSLQEYLQK